MTPDSHEAAAQTATEPIALLVDDEALARARLKQLLHEAWPGLRCVEAEDTQSAARQLSLPGVVAVFLDIHMPGMDGMTWLAQRATQGAGYAGGSGPPVVLVSADAGQALHAFSLDALDYLTKPVGRERLAQCVAKIRRAQALPLAPPSLSAPSPHPAAALDPAKSPSAALQVLLQDRQRLLRVPISEVLYWRADQKLLELQTTTACHVLDGSLQSWQDQLGDRVLRVHRNMLVPVQALRQLKSGTQGWILQLQVANAPPCWVPVSRRQLVAVKQAMKQIRNDS